MGLAKLSDFLKRKRTDAKLTQGQVAEILGYTSPQFVSNWERGLAYPPIETLKRLAKIYGIDLNEVYEAFLSASVSDMERDLKEKFFSEKKSRRSSR
ncbi:MAG TPA: helix-turn-helix transcriptional regulator [Bdellovibrio sp.]|uniref:helix-turn-helix domain-containing protein n=1 Tax=Bdellovibrio sp. TaxID=28201 RepID=UPI002EFB66CF